MYPVETIRRQTVHKNEPADIVLPDSAREEDTVTFVSDLSYVTFGNDPLSYRIDTLDPRKLKEEGLPVEDRAAALERLELRDARQFDDVFHYNVSVTRGGKGRRPNITFNVKTVELFPFVDVQRFYVQLQGKKEVAVRHLTTSERTTVKMELSPESEAGKNAFGEFTVIPLKFPPRVLFTPHLIHRLPPTVIQDVIRFGADDG